MAGWTEVILALDAMERDQLIEQLRRAVEVIERLQAENDSLRKELERLLRQQGRGGHGARKKRRAQPRKCATGAGAHRHRAAPPRSSNDPCIRVPVEETSCPHCGGQLDDDSWEHVSTTEIPKALEPEVTHFEVQSKKCKRCGRKVRGRHPNLAPDQHGATAHRLGDRALAVAQTLHYGLGIPQRKVPIILKELSNIKVTQGALSQDARRRARQLEPDYAQLRDRIRNTAVVHTDDTGWRVGGQPAQMMVFATEQGDTLYQIRPRHRNEEVREVLPSDWEGIMVTDRGRAYDAWQFAGVKQHKCSYHLLGSIQQVLEDKKGAARWFGLELKDMTQASVALWNALRENSVDQFTYQKQSAVLQAKIDWHLRERKLQDPDNERLRRELAKHNDRGNLFRYLRNPSVPTTNNLAEREVRPAVVARKVSQCSKSWTGAHSREVLQSIVRSEARKHPPSLIESVRQKFHDARHRARQLLGPKSNTSLVVRLTERHQPQPPG